MTPWTRQVDTRLPGRGNSNSHGAQPVHQVSSMIKWIRTSRLSIKNSLSEPPEEEARNLSSMADPVASTIVSRSASPNLKRKIDIRLPGKGNSNSHDARPVY